MLTFTGPTQLDHTAGVLDGSPRTICILNTGTAPVALSDVRVSADWITYALVPPDVAPDVRVAASHGSPLAMQAEALLPSLVDQERHMVWPGERGAWYLNLYCDATHPAAATGIVSVDVTVEGERGPVTRQLSLYVALQEPEAFAGLFALDWGNATLAGAYVPRDSFVPRPIPVLVDADDTAREVSAIKRAALGPGGAGDSPARSDGNGSTVRRAGESPTPPGKTSTRLGSPAALYVDDAQDKFAPLVATARDGESRALADASVHAPNLIENIKRVLTRVPPYGGLTADDLDIHALIPDRFSSNAFQTAEYSLSQLATLLVASTVHDLAQQPRRLWDEHGQLLTLPEPLGAVHDVVLTYPPLLPKPLRTEMQRWFEAGGLRVRGSRDWDDLTAIACHALFQFIQDRDGRIEALVRRFGTHIPMLIADVGSTSARAGRLDIEINLDDAADDNGHRGARITITHRAVAEYPQFNGERLHLRIFHQLKRTLAEHIADRLVAAGEGQLLAEATAESDKQTSTRSRPYAKAFGSALSKSATGATAAREREKPRIVIDPTDLACARGIAEIKRRREVEQSAARAAGRTRVATTAMATSHHDMDQVDRLVPTRYRDAARYAPGSPAAEASRRLFTVLALAARRALEALDRGAGAWSPADDAVVAPALTALLTRRHTTLANDADLLTGVRLTVEDVVEELRAPVEGLGRALRDFATTPLPDLDPRAYEDSVLGDKGSAGQRLRPPAYLNDDVDVPAFGPGGAGVSPAWQPANPTDERAGRPLPQGGHPGLGGDIGATAYDDHDYIEDSDEPQQPWVLLAGGATQFPFVRDQLLAALGVRGEHGLTYKSAHPWPESAATEPGCVALGACEAEHAIASGLKLEVRDALTVLPADIGLRTDRFVTLFPRGTPVNAVRAAKLPDAVTGELTLWYRFTASDEPTMIQPLGTFHPSSLAGAPGSTWYVTLVPTGDGGSLGTGGWDLRLTRGTPAVPPGGSARRAGGVTLDPATPSTPLEWSLTSGIH